MNLDTFRIMSLDRMNLSGRLSLFLEWLERAVAVLKVTGSSPDRGG